MIKEALHKITKKFNKSEAEIIRCLKNGEPAYHSELRFELARQIISLLTSVLSIKKVFIHGSAANNSSGPASDIDLVFKVTDKNPFLVRLIEICNKELTAEYKRVIKNSNLDILLNAQFIGDEDPSNIIENWHYNPARKIYDVEAIDILS